MADLADEVRRALFDRADPSRAPAMQAYMKSAMPFLGISAPARAAALRPVLSAHRLPDAAALEDVVRRLWDEAVHREERYAAIAVCRHRYYTSMLTPERLDLFRHLIVTGAWWDLVDDVAVHLVGAVLLTHHDAAAPAVLRWADDDDLWLRRAALICQVLARGRTDRSLLEHALLANLEPSVHGSEFFIRKAAGWALRCYSETDPAWVTAFVDVHREEMSGLSRREALRTIG